MKERINPCNKFHMVTYFKKLPQSFPSLITTILIGQQLSTSRQETLHQQNDYESHMAQMVSNLSMKYF